MNSGAVLKRGLRGDGDFSMQTMSELLAKFGGSEAILKRTIQTYLDFWPSEYEAFLSALQDQDSEAVAKKAHRIKGFVGYFSSDETYDLVVSIEHAAKADDLGEVEKLNQSFSKELNSMSEELTEMVKTLA